MGVSVCDCVSVRRYAYMCVSVCLCVLVCDHVSVRLCVAACVSVLCEKGSPGEPARGPGPGAQHPKEINHSAPKL